jgi:hypothetical protein
VKFLFVYGTKSLEARSTAVSAHFVCDTRSLGLQSLRLTCVGVAGQEQYHPRHRFPRGGLRAQVKGGSYTPLCLVWSRGVVVLGQ